MNQTETKPQKDSALMHKAQRENFTIYLLRGILAIMRTSHIRNHVPMKLRGEIEVAAMQSIECIKDVQLIRMLNNPDPNKRAPKP